LAATLFRPNVWFFDGTNPRGIGRHQIIKDALLNRGGSLLRVFDREFVLAWFFLRFLDARLSNLPKIGSTIDNKDQTLLVHRKRRCGIANANAVVTDSPLPFTRLCWSILLPLLQRAKFAML
jgi:hypothetical protein